MHQPKTPFLQQDQFTTYTHDRNIASEIKYNSQKKAKEIDTGKGEEFINEIPGGFDEVQSID